ncbi:MAG: MBL fold metallo-hydrolase [Planctomycetota bacterium]|jgi:ribonuclease BN (tRNA processing enzyme)
MRLTFVGTGAAVPSISRSAPSLLLQEEDANMVLDMGPGSLKRLLDYGVPYPEVTHVVITHFHTDHASDLAAFFQAMAVRDGDRPLTMIGPPGFEAFLEKHFECFKLGGRKWPRLKGIFELGSGTMDADPFTVSAAQVEHKDESTAYRVASQGGKTFAYSGDTGACDGIVEVGRGADLLVLECSLPDDYDMDLHLTPSKAAAVAEQANPGKVALTHFYPLWDERDMEAEIKTAFGARPVIIAEDGMSLEI